MMEKNYTDVVIDDKVYTVGCDRDSAYMQEVAAYVNEKLQSMRSQSGFNKQPYGSRQIMILMNMADDYMRMKLAADEMKTRYQEQENEFYNMKRELVSMKMQMDQIRLQNQVLAMGVDNEAARERLMADVIQSVRKDADSRGEAVQNAASSKSETSGTMSGHKTEKHK